MRYFHAVFERAGLVAFAFFAAHLLYLQTLGLVFFHFAAHHFLRFVGGVVEHMNLESVGRVVKLSDAVNEALGHIHFVVQRQLNRHEGVLFVALLLAHAGGVFNSGEGSCAGIISGQG